ncbi:MAG: D-2-hydroxyacid dehydrogenase [Dehalococcoidia bacterium]|nr:D-2-hydroxyacid dehydrogenase [Dehalococcoidia bacterium]
MTIGFPLEPDQIEAIKRVSPLLRITELSPEAFRVLVAWDEPQAAVDEEIRAGIEGAEVIFSSMHRPEYLRHATRLSWLQLFSAGADRLMSSMRDGMIANNFTVTNVSGLHATSIGEYVMGTMIMFSKNLHSAVRDQTKHEWNPGWISELKGATVGVVGMGAIGSEVAQMSKAFGMRVLGMRRSVQTRGSDPLADEVFPPSELRGLLGESDYVVLVVPLTPATTGLIGEVELAAMKPSAFLINVSRGAVIDDEALLRSLRQNGIGGAALDVFAQEPLPANSPFWDLPNVIVTPHISGRIKDYGSRATEIFIRNLERYIKGEPLFNAVDVEDGY